MPQILQLPPDVVNKIAAGEVIERPASVVKELMENAIDAGSTRVDVSLEQGGMQLVRVADDGCGMTADQLPLAVASHATSKIRDADDLFRVGTLGFRGEALASIAAISRMRIRGRAAGEDSGAELEVVGGAMGEVTPCGCPPGTTIEVRDLFYNTPVRRKFMRTTQTEVGHAAEAFNRIALSHPHVHLTLRHNQRTLQELPACERWRDRIASVFGEELAEGLIWVESQDEQARIQGYVADPQFSRAANRMQYLFLNGRHIRDRSLQHALGEAYRGLLLTGRFPIAFLRLELPPDAVDVNVHPTKLEVRFVDSGRLYSQLLGAIRSKFLTTDLTARVQPVAPSGGAAGTSGGADEPAGSARTSGQAPGNPAPGNSAHGNPAPGNPAPGSGWAAGQSGSAEGPARNAGYVAGGWSGPDGRGAPAGAAHDVEQARRRREEVIRWAQGQLPAVTTPGPLSGLAAPAGLTAPPERAASPGSAGSPAFGDGSGSLQIASRQNGHDSLEAGRHEPGDGSAAAQGGSGTGWGPGSSGNRPAGVAPVPVAAGGQRGMQMQNRYLVTEDEQGIVVIDQHALHERVLYEQFRTKVLSGGLESQRLLVPETVAFSPAEAAAALDACETLAELGIRVEPFGGDTLLVTSYPAMLASVSPGELLRQVVDRLMAGAQSLERRDLLDELLHMIACKAAVKAGDRLSPEEVVALLEQRHLCQDAHHCPHGRPTALLFTREELDKRFRRT